MQTTKTVVFWLVIMASAFVLWQVVRTGGSAPPDPEISYSSFLSRIAKGEVSKVSIMGSMIRGYDTKGGTFRVVIPSNQSAVLDALEQHGVDIWFRESPEQGWPTWLLNLAPLVLLAALWFFMIRQMQAKRKGLRATGQTPAPSPETQTRFGP
jgi:cell division protease FtsH